MVFVILGQGNVGPASWARSIIIDFPHNLSDAPEKRNPWSTDTSIPPGILPGLHANLL